MEVQTNVLRSFQSKVSYRISIVQKGGTVMRRKIVVLITATILVVGMAVETALAADRAARRYDVSYSTTGTQTVKSITASSGTNTTGHLSPGVASNAVKLLVWDVNQNQCCDEQTYVPYPVNPNTVNYTFSNSATVKYKVRPVIDNQYIWGTGVITETSDP